MAYVSDNLNKVAGGFNGQELWTYKGVDIHTDVDAADFFSDGYAKGMKVDDIVIVCKTTATRGATLHLVDTVTVGGAATIGAAILA